MYLVSACLAGFNTRYDGGSRPNAAVIALVKSGQAIPVCPEQLAGLKCPRLPVSFRGCTGAEVLDGNGVALNSEGINHSEALINGAREVLRIARMYEVEGVILKDGSPSCGVSYIYDGDNRKEGRGVTSELLHREGFKVLGPQDMDFK